MSVELAFAYVYPDVKPQEPEVLAQLDAIARAGVDHKHRWLYGDHWNVAVRCGICRVPGLVV